MSTGSYPGLFLADIPTGKAMRQVLPIKEMPWQATGSLPIRGVCPRNLRRVNVDIPLGTMIMMIGMAGSDRSTLISQVPVKLYESNVIMVDQGPITATNRSTPASYLDFSDETRRLLTGGSGRPDSLFSFSSARAYPICGGEGIIVTELTSMDPIVTEYEACDSTRYNGGAPTCTYKGKNIVELPDLTTSQAPQVSEDVKIRRRLKMMEQAGLSYLTLGQPLSILPGGERQRTKLAKNLGRRESIVMMDEPTTGLHVSDIENLLKLFDLIASRGNTSMVTEHNLDVTKRVDWLTDTESNGGKSGGQMAFTGTPMEMLHCAEILTTDSLRAFLGQDASYITGSAAHVCWPCRTSQFSRYVVNLFRFIQLPSLYCMEVLRNPILQPVPLLQSQQGDYGFLRISLFNRFRGNTAGGRIWRDISCHHGPGSDYGSVPNYNPCHNDCLMPYPYIISQDNISLVAPGFGHTPLS